MVKEIEVSGKQTVKKVMDWVDDGIPKDVLKYYVYGQIDGNSEDCLILCSKIPRDDSTKNEDFFKNNDFRVIFSMKDSAETSEAIYNIEQARVVFGFVKRIMRII